MKWIVALLLALMFMGGAALVYWGPAHGYLVACEKQAEIACTLERETREGVRRWQLALGSDAEAVVRVVPVRRSTARVLLYLKSPAREVFAAEFKGGEAAVAAAAAAAQLNQVFTSRHPASVRLEIRPPAHMLWLAWGALGFLGLFVLAALQALRRLEPTAASHA